MAIAAPLATFPDLISAQNNPTPIPIFADVEHAMRSRKTPCAESTRNLVRLLIPHHQCISQLFRAFLVTPGLFPFQGTSFSRLGTKKANSER